MGLVKMSFDLVMMYISPDHFKLNYRSRFKQMHIFPYLYIYIYCLVFIQGMKELKGQVEGLPLVNYNLLKYICK